MQSQMIGMQSSLDRILAVVQQNQPMSQPMMYNNNSENLNISPQMPFLRRNGADIYNNNNPSGEAPPRSRFPPLPGFAPPVRKAHITN